ncbi:MAG: epoxyqueuosine reductase QueH [Clostridia bacterium]|nr:epoxyqueuosine reductase QueH [Clostridia bacterium]
MQSTCANLEEIMESIKQTNKKPTLLLHVCCAPCSSYVIEYLSDFFDITLYFYNPNITNRDEYVLRLCELKRFITEMPKAKGISVIEGEYNVEEFLRLTKAFAQEKEGGNRCFICYKQRLFSTAQKAKEMGFDYFTTTLTVSPYKNAKKLNEIGAEAAEIYNTSYLFSNFKKKNGYKRSIELSKEYNLYRQNFCGCVYSKTRILEKNVK